MPSFRSPSEQARRLVRRKVQHGKSRRQRHEAPNDFISSIGTEVKYRGNIKRLIEWLSERRLSIDNVTVEIVREFLNEKRDVVTQKTLDGYRQSFNLVLNLNIEYVSSNKPTVLEPRAYREDQISLLCASTQWEMGVAIEICSSAGLRPHELDTIARIDELHEDDRPWLPERFSGLEAGMRYVVIGKGGLRRTVMLPIALALELEKMRLQTPVIKHEREINYLKRFGVLGGQAFSQRFSSLSKRVLGWSAGAHGLRHSFAQRRMRTLQRSGFQFDFALEVLAQEMGHFSTTNTLTYLR
ncbi:MAG TPA: hypothetical protein VEC35_07530 [Noviherbaspirillum sp.]|nr:hypothetical protein [Noviherbaspirillum sp.]